MAVIVLITGARSTLIVTFWVAERIPSETTTVTVWLPPRAGAVQVTELLLPVIVPPEVDQV